MMYRGRPGTGTPLIDFDELPATGPILGYSHEAVANLYTYAQNDPINRVDPSGLQSVMTDEGRQRRAVRYAEVVNARIVQLGLTPITLQDALRDGTLTGAEITRLALTADEIESILGKNFAVTLQNFEAAERAYPNLPPAEAYMRQMARVNYGRAKLKLALQNTDLRWAIDEFYEIVRGFNPVHFVMEKGYVIGSGEEPVLQRPASRGGAAFDLVLYLLVLKGTSTVLSKLKGAALAPLSPTGGAGGVIEFPNGGRLEVPRGFKYDPIELENAFNEAAAGKKIALKGEPTVHIDIGGEGRYPDAINVNPNTTTTTTGTAGRPIQNLVQATSERLPFANQSVDVITLENLQITQTTASEIARVIKPGGKIRLVGPADYARTAHQRVIQALPRGSTVGQTTVGTGDTAMTTTIIRVPGE